MRSELFHAEDLALLLRRKKIATMPELKKILGTNVDATVFRKLKQLPYRSSYSHRGSYYALEETAHFDEAGLWSFDSVRFSRYGTLVETAEALAAESEAGYFVEELDRLLHVETKDPLRRLVQHQRLGRESMEGRYLYCSVDTTVSERQILSRRKLQEEPSPTRGVAKAADEEVKASMVLFFSALNEKQRRLYAGLESIKLGYGGDRRIAEFLGVDAHTVAAGRGELERHDVNVERIRKVGAGRTPVEKKRRKSSPESKS